MFAGAGVKRGFVLGESDRIAEYPASSPYSPGDLAATLFWTLGLDHSAEIRDQVGCSFRPAEGEPIRALFG